MPCSTDAELGISVCWTESSIITKSGKTSASGQNVDFCVRFAFKILLLFLLGN